MIAITGGAGYIGSHTCLALDANGIEYLILDNFSRSKRSVLDRLHRITGKFINYVDIDISDADSVCKILKSYGVSAVIHFAAFKSVEESIKNPVLYYENNVLATVALLKAMRAAEVGTIVFSSSATVYGSPHKVPIFEEFPLSPVNPYGWSKLIAEQILADISKSEPGFWRIARLRYFNPVGAHESGLIGEDPLGTPNNLLPYICQVASGTRAILNIWGNDYPTIDGTGVRDYIHVMDLAEGHLAALNFLDSQPSMVTLNLGAGVGVSVLDLVQIFCRVSGVNVPYQFAARRPGDVAECWADTSTVFSLLNWRTKRDLVQICEDAWRWQSSSTSMN